MRWSKVAATVGAALLALLMAPAHTAALGSPSTAEADTGPFFPELIRLPDGFQPEGVATGRGLSVYAGSQADGAIYRANVLTGRGRVLVSGEQGREANGITVDARNRIFVAGLSTGKATVYDAASGKLLADYRLAPRGSFLNDVVVTRDAAYLTDSKKAVLYVLPLGAGGRLPARDAVRRVPLTGDFVQRDDGLACSNAPDVNANGIETSPDGRSLILGQTNTGKLFSVNPRTGVTTTIALGGKRVGCNDGLLRRGNTLYAVQNFRNQVAVLRLAGTREARLVDTIRSPNLDVPTTLGEFGPFRYTVNGRFTTPPQPDTRYDIVRLPAFSARPPTH